MDGENEVTTGEETVVPAPVTEGEAAPAEEVAVPAKEEGAAE